MYLQEGQSVLEIGCGTGENFSYLYTKVGPSGKIIGVDYNEKMLEFAQRKVSKSELHNVELYQADAAQFTAPYEIHAVLFADVLFVIPDFKLALEKAILAIENKGHVSILDFKLSDRPLFKILNGLWRG